MPRIRVVEISNFRGISEFSWFPNSGLNCLIGPGDSGKSTILDAIDLCIGARRTYQFSDADFFELDVTKPIRIEVTIGELSDALKSLETYGLYVRGFHAHLELTEDEPEKDAETVLTIKLSVSRDLEPNWTLVSERASALGQTRALTWGDRVRIAPVRLGVASDYHLSWWKGSVLNRITDERVEASGALAEAARAARTTFANEAKLQLKDALTIVSDTARGLGIDVGNEVHAMLDNHAVSFSAGTISLHDEDGIPLRSLGTGSTRLLIAGLQGKASSEYQIVLIDELEYGLEPHRIIRLLGTLGSKDADPPLQVFMTTHSPVALRELSGNQLFVIRPGDKHQVLPVTSDDLAQGTIRLFPDAFLATSVIVCEGASEIGFLRGIDQHRSSKDMESINAQGVALVDAKGGGPNDPFKRAAAFQELGYRVAILRDDDQKPDHEVEKYFKDRGGSVFTWEESQALEDQLFASVSIETVGLLVDHAILVKGQDLVDDNIKSAAQNRADLASIQTEIREKSLSAETRRIIGKAAKSKGGAWFKTVSVMEDISRDIIGPSLPDSDRVFRTLIENLFLWASRS